MLRYTWLDEAPDILFAPVGDFLRQLSVVTVLSLNNVNKVRTDQHRCHRCLSYQNGRIFCNIAFNIYFVKVLGRYVITKWTSWVSPVFHSRILCFSRFWSKTPSSYPNPMALPIKNGCGQSISFRCFRFPFLVQGVWDFLGCVGFGRWRFGAVKLVLANEGKPVYGRLAAFDGCF